jgi:Mg/Co/Ni transporter MgtE
MPTRHLPTVRVSSFSHSLPTGYEWGVTIQATIVSTFFKESQMTKSRTQVAFAMVVFSAVVAVFSGVVAVPFLNAGKHSLPAVPSNGVVTLIADGGDPQPPPTPLPWLV